MITRAGSTPFWRPLAVLLGLGPEVVDVVEHHLVEVADPGVEVAGDGDVEDQGQPVAPGALDAGVLVVGDDRLVGGGGADDQVGLDQGLVQSRSNGTAWPPQRAAAASARSGLRLVTRIRPGLQRLEVLEGQVAHLARRR